ncbi:MAG: trypsin-like serine protease [Spirochaetes bacterium]|nr:trypsin-like serine protease [Spirochaetota bacterium]
MKPISLIIPFLILSASTAAFPVTVRHDTDNARYTALAKRHDLAAGLVVTRPSAGTPGCGVLIHRRYVLTAGHIGSEEGPADMPVRYGETEYRVEHVYLFPRFKMQKNKWGGCDIAVLRLRGEGIPGVQPATLWTGGVRAGQRFIGLGQGRSGTGAQNDEPLAAGTFRGYENTVDFIFGEEEYNLLAADFDGPDGVGNSLSSTLFHPARTAIAGNSSAAPLALEGSLAAGDSGSGIWVDFGGGYCLVGIATLRVYSCYGGQGYYVNLGNQEIARWILSICPEAEAAGGR